MSEHEGGDSKVGAFLLGFLVGVLVCLGAGGVFFAIQANRMAMLAREAAMQEQMARRAAEEARERLDAERRALEAQNKAKAAKDKDGK